MAARMTWREEDLVPLPGDAARLLEAAGAPPRLLAHARLVADAAARILDWLGAHHPGVAVDAEAVLFGAAVHDIGKTRHPSELTAPGHAHEEAGAALLAERGVPVHRARFCRTHGGWKRDELPLEDLLVSLADKVWKGARVEALELHVVHRIAAAAAVPAWEAFSGLDEALTDLAADAEARLAFQARHPVR